MKNRNFDRKMDGVAGLFILLAFALVGCTPRQPLLPTAAVVPSKTPAPFLTDTATVVAPSPLPRNTLTPTPAALTAEITDAKGVVMRLVPAGSFIMGSNDGMPDEKPPHTVSLPAFYMDRYEVTNALYKVCVDAGMCQIPANTSDGVHSGAYGTYNNRQFDNNPVIWVDWNRANAYCQWRGARLPTEAEWEKAARSTDGRIYPWGEGIDSALANYGGNAPDKYAGVFGKTVAVGSYPGGVSPYGIEDMAGNVWEWVADWYDVYPGGDASVNEAFGKQTYRVLRGGGWSDDPSLLRATFRGGNTPDTAVNYIGFRCALSH